MPLLRLTALILCLSVVAFGVKPRKSKPTSTDNCDGILSQINDMHRIIALQELTESKETAVVEARKKHYITLAKLINDGVVSIEDIKEYGVQELTTDDGIALVAVQTSKVEKAPVPIPEKQLVVLEAPGLKGAKSLPSFPCQVSELFERDLIKGRIPVPNGQVFEYRPNPDGKYPIVLRAHDGKLPKELAALEMTEDPILRDILNNTRTGFIGWVKKAKLKAKDFSPEKIEFYKVKTENLLRNKKGTIYLVRQKGKAQEPDTFIELFPTSFFGNTETRGWTDLSGKLTHSTPSTTEYLLEGGASLEANLDISTLNTAKPGYKFKFNPAPKD